MSEKVRFKIEGCKVNQDLASICITFVKDENGEYVRYEDYARLQAEVERLTIQGGDSEPRFVLLSEYQHLKGLLAFATTKYCRLEAEVERLRKAGDDLAGMVGYHVPYEDQIELEKAWNAAKEGKPSA